MSTTNLPILDRADSNLNFLILEVTSQVENLRRFLLSPSAGAKKRIASRDDYVDSLKRLVEEQCFRLLNETKDLAGPAANLLRAMITVAANLERVGDMCVNLMMQADHLRDVAFLQKPVLHEGLNDVLATLQLIRHALIARNVPLAMRISQVESELDQRYKETFENVLSSLDTAADRGDSITFLNMVHYLERMGDLLLNIGEAIVFAAVGARLKLHDYVALEDMLKNADSPASIDAIQVERIWDSRSGMSIGRVLGNGDHEAPDLIVKEGNPDKLVRERDSISRWQSLRPGLTPRVFGYRESDHMAALLMEYLHGHTMQALMIAGPGYELKRAYRRFSETVPELWKATEGPVARRANYVAQITARLDDVRRLHPSFFSREMQIGSVSVASLEELVARVAEVEESLEAPFSVLIHGDFNANNVIYDDAQDRIHFIDLYRSAEGDFLQDASVFLASCLRIPVFDHDVRARLNWVATSFLAVVREFAQQHGDRDVERRLALGLSRSFLTSTRFIPDPLFAEELFVRAIYLMEALTRSGGTGMFRVPEEIVVWRGALAA
jgi:phosphate uptake regulator/aminoglycoside phosphotransferase